MRCSPPQIFQPRRSGRGRAPRLKMKAALLGLIIACLACSLHAPEVRAQAETTKGQSVSSSTSPQPPAFDALRAFEHVRRLVEFGPRPAGSKELKRAREYIVKELKSSGLKVERDEFDA